ncbi:polysaccharide biosynthesis/export family protein [Ruegeria arenilitoris]|uniref:polysaccharide biosynthesis/export family protein n=1 Tax=Ruegeria arenilitoris TaxID=1173585 RepID=UPI00147CE146|nr:polysaccharide biosynthesis/export family protein [Ruegeria arenilitoris]
MLFRLMILALIFLMPASAMAEPYSFVSGDTLLVRAGRWDHSTQNFSFWDGVSGEYRISSSGEIQIPLAGTIMASGKTADDLSTAISLQIQRRIGLTSPPEVAIEIAGHPPIYVGGFVTNPGAYPFRLGMTVQQAVAQSGGVGSSDGTEENTERELIRLSGQMRILTNEIAALEAEEARLVAEVAAIEIRAADGTPTANGEGIDGIERELFIARQRSFDTREANIQELQEVVAEQVLRLDAQLELRQQQVALAREEAEVMGELKDRGLAARTRETAVLSDLAGMEVQLSALEVARLNAQQQLNLARRDEITLFDEARLSRLAALRDVRNDLTNRRAELETAKKLYAEATVRGTAGVESDEAVKVVYVISREVNGAFERIQADPTTRLAPRDTLEITVEVLPPSAGN